MDFIVERLDKEANMRKDRIRRAIIFITAITVLTTGMGVSSLSMAEDVPDEQPVVYEEVYEEPVVEEPVVEE